MAVFQKVSQPKFPQEPVIRPSSIEDLYDIIKSPYRQHSNAPSSGVGKAALNRNGKRISNMMPIPAPRSVGEPSGQASMTGGRAKSIPFGSRSRRPIGQESLDQIIEFTYIPDIRKINAMSTVQLKEERMAEVARQKNSQKLLRGQASLSSFVYNNSNSTSKPANSFSTINRSKSTVAPYSTNLYSTNQVSSHEKHVHLPKLLQAQSQTTLFRSLDGSTEKQKNTYTSSAGDISLTYNGVTEVSHGKRTQQDVEKKQQTTVGDRLTAQIQTRTTPGAGWHKEQAKMITIQENDDRVDDNDTLHQTFLQTQKGSEFQRSRSTQQKQMRSSTEYDQYINSGSAQVIARAKESARYHDDDNSERALQNEHPSRILLKADSVQQMSHATLNPNTQRQEYSMTKKRKSKSTRRIKMKPSGAAGGLKKQTRDMGTSASLIERASLSPFDSLVQTRKLAPQTHTSPQKLLAKESAYRLHSQQAAKADNQIILERLAGEFLDQLRGFGVNQDSPVSGQNKQTKLPQIPSKSVASMDNSSYQPEQSQDSSMYLSQARTKKQNQENLMQQRELLSVISTQKFLDPAAESKNSSYLTQQQHGSRLDLVIGSQDSKKESKIPRKVLQQELTNEKIYAKAPIPQKSKKTARKRVESVDPILRHERKSKSDLKEIIPRLNDFPMQGKSIQVKGHDDKVFSTSSSRELIERSNDYKKEIALKQQAKTQAQVQAEKVTQNWQAIHRNKKSIDLILSDVKQNRSIGHLGVREHYLDDEAKGRRFMANVAPTSYEISDKQVVVPNLQPHIAPAVIYKDQQKENNLSKYQKLAAKNKEAQAIRLGLSVHNSISFASKTVDDEDVYKLSPRQRNKSLMLETPMRDSVGTSFTPALLEAKMPLNLAGNSRNFSQEHSTAGVDRTETQMTQKTQKTPPKKTQLQVRALRSNQQSIYSSLQLSAGGDTKTMNLENTSQVQEDKTPVDSEILVVNKLGDEEPYPQLIQQQQTTKIDENYTGLIVGKKSLIRRESKEKFPRNGSGARVSPKNSQNKSKMKSQGTESMMPREFKPVQDYSISPKRQQELSPSRQSQALQMQQQPNKAGAKTSTTKSNNAQSNMDIDDVLDTQEQKLSRKISLSDIQENVIFIKATNQDQKLPSEMYAKKEDGGGYLDTKRKKSSPFRQNSIIKNHKGIALSQLSKQNRNLSTRDLPTKGIVEKTNTGERIQIPEMVSYQIQGAVYGGIGSEGVSDSTYRRNMGTSSQAMPSSVDITPIRPLQVTTFEDRTKTMSIMNGYNHDERLGTKDNSAQLTTGRNSSKAQLNIQLKQATGQAQGQIQIKKVVVREAAGINIRLKTGIVNQSPTREGDQDLDYGPVTTLQLVNTTETEASPMKQSFNSLNHQSSEHLLEQTDPPLDMAAIQHILTISDQVQLRSHPSNEKITEASVESQQSLTGTAQKLPLKQMIEQVKVAKREREIRHKKGNIVSGSAIVGTEARFKQQDAVRQQEQTPGPGSYEAIYVKDISYQQPSKRGPAQQAVSSSRAAQAKKTTQPLESNTYLGQSMNDTADDDKSQLTLAGQSMNRQPSTQKLAAATPSRPSANFASKVPRDPSLEEKKDFTGTIDYNDQSANTISKAQNDLTLRTVQKMFAGRKEQHTLNVHKLVRINRLKQLNKVDPNINYTLPEETSQVTPLEGSEISGGEFQYLAMPLNQPGSDSESNSKFPLPNVLDTGVYLEETGGSFGPSDSFGFIVIENDHVDDGKYHQVEENFTPKGTKLNRDLQSMQLPTTNQQLQRFASHDHQFNGNTLIPSSGPQTNKLEVVQEKRQSADTIQLPNSSIREINGLNSLSPPPELASMNHDSSGLHSNRYSIQESPEAVKKLSHKRGHGNKKSKFKK